MSLFEIKKDKIIYLASSFFLYIIFIILFSCVEQNSKEIAGSTITLLSWIGIIECLFIIVKNYKVNGNLFTLYNIFLSFFIVFNFGQCILWALDIHTDNEIGIKAVYSSVQANNLLIAKSQLIFMISVYMLDAGVYFVSSDENFKVKKITENDNFEKICLYKASIILTSLSAPAAIYKSIIRLYYSKIYSYHDLYYGEIATKIDNTFINIFSSLFLTSIIGLIIGANFKKSVRVFCYILYFIYSILTLLCGDRGEWINGFIILIWLHNFYINKINVRKLIAAIPLLYLGLWAIDVIKSLRNDQFTLNAIIETFKNGETPIISMLTEFGQTMGILIILLNTKVPLLYGNTYAKSFLTIFSTGLYNRIFHDNYVQLHTWFPMEYLQITYGTDFSMIGEAVLNYGVYFAPLIILIFGIILGMIVKIPYKKNSPLNLSICISLVSNILRIARSTLWLTLNSIIYIIIITKIIYYLTSLFISYRKNTIYK